MKTLRTSNDWYLTECDKYIIMDPDGWDRSNYRYSFYEEKITKEEYNGRVLKSTVIRQLDIEEECRLKHENSNDRGV